MSSRKKNEQSTLDHIGSKPIERPVLLPNWKAGPPEMQLRVWMRTRQTFVYHVCDVVGQDGWSGVQSLLNEIQRELENLYDSCSVELVNIYRKTQTKADGICIIAIFKIGPIAAPQQEPQRVGVTTWRRRIAA